MKWAAKWLHGVVAALGLALLAAPASARVGDWEQLGVRTIDGRRDADLIKVGRYMGAFTAIRFEARGGNLAFREFLVAYENGDVERYDVKRVLREGDAPLDIDLRGNKRFIKHIEMLYSERARSQVVMNVLGKSAGNLDLPDQHELLQTREYASTSRQIDLWVGIKEGYHNRIRFRALDRSVAIRSGQVEFDDGETVALRIGERLGLHEYSDPIQISDVPRRIVKITLNIRPNNEEPGRVQLISIRPPGGFGPPRQADRGDRSDRGGGFDVIETAAFDQRSRSVVIDVGRRDGRFNALKLRAVEGTAPIRRVEIVFGNGERQQVDFRGRLREGEESQPIDLAGERRFIREVEVELGPMWVRGQRRLQVLGLKR